MTITEDHEAYKENTRLAVGEVLLLKQEQVHDAMDRPFFRRLVQVGDESDANPEMKQAFVKMGEQAEKQLLDHPEWKRTIIRPKTHEVIIDPANEAARWLYYDQDGNPTQMIDWAKDFPTAIALEPLQRLKKGGRRLPGGKLDARTLELFINMLDPIGIRSRAHIYSQRIVELSGSVDRPLDIMSVGSGAAVPNIEATRRVEDEQGKHINWQFFDTDPRALQFANELIWEAGFKESTFGYGPRFMDESGWVYQGRGFEDAYEQQDESVDVVDALGLWEYLRDETARDFAQNLYAKVRPGGMMIVSNMLKDRPQLEFNKRGVGWPHLVRRSEDDLLTVLAAAGIDTNNVTMTHAKDGVYVVVEIQKP